MDIDELVIRLHLKGPAADGEPSFVVHLDGDAGEAPEQPIRLPTRERLRELATLFAERDGWHPDCGQVEERRANLLREVGRELADELWRGKVGNRWAASVGTGPHPVNSLRLVFRMPLDEAGCGRLGEVPWEALLPPSRESPLALDPGVSIVRWLEQSGKHQPPPAPKILKVLAITAGNLPGLEPLHVNHEVGALQREAAESRGKLEVVVARDVPLADWSRLLWDHRPHVLHFVGHGGFDPVGQKGLLFLPDGRGRVDRVDGARLACILADAAWRRMGEAEGRDERRGPGLRLVFLNACRTAEAAAESPFAGVATRLVRDGQVPAVLAMQYPVRDGSASLFSRELYGRIARGEALEPAIRAARVAIRTRDRGSSYWVAPALFSRLPQGRLFAEVGAEAEAARPTRGRDLRWPGVAAAVLVTILGLLSLSGQLHPGGSPDVPAGTFQSVPEDREVSILVGKPVHFEKLGIDISVQFLFSQDPAIATFTVLGLPEELEPQPAWAPDDLTFETSLGTLHLTVLELDPEAGTAVIRPPRLMR